MRILISSIAALILSAGTTLAEDRRVIAIGSSVTEIIYALGQQDRLVGRDRTSTYPKAALELPDVGYRRALSPEGVLSVEPDLILALEGSGPPDAIKVLQEAGVDYVTVADTFSRDGVVEKILTIGAALGVEAEAEALAAQASKQMALAESNAQNLAGQDRQRVLFILNARDGDITVGGAGTQADSIIKMAGGINAAAAVEGFKPITPEALAVTAPDVILMMERQGNHAVSDEDLFSLPAIQLTPAGRSTSLIRMPGAYLLGFGPRTAEAIADLSAALQDVNGS
ncbi:ABC transporter substrate-binding protein [Ruegeria sp. SCPT10]|uniref:heme/hemin ABC transporter substrate-binding protein n=1 Tax=Ruegeria sp. SCP10 TaxID=3141377 RepID=UPI003335D381